MKYPNQVISYKRPEKVIGVDAALSLQTDESPLEMHSGFSRFVVSIVDKKQNIAPTANIPARDVAAIYEKSKAAMAHLVSSALMSNVQISNGENTPSLSATEKIFLKPFTGMTPAEILLADPNNQAELEKLRDQVLAKNADKYPKNKRQIEAIDEAIKLMLEGKLDGGNKEAPAVTSNKPYNIYATEYKYKNKQNEKGYNLVYSISIVFDPSKNNPFIVNITNCFAPVESLGDGRKNIVMGKAEDTQKAFFALTTEEYFELASVLKNTKERFEMINFKNQYKLMEDNSYKHE